MDSGKQIQLCNSGFYGECYRGLFIQDVPGNVCQIFRIPNIFVVCFILDALVLPHFLPDPVGWKLRNWRVLALGACLWRPQQVLKCWVSMVSTWDEQLSAETEGFCLKEPRKFSYFSGLFQLLLAPDSFSLYPENDVSYSIWGKCICPGSKFAVRYALCWSLAERHIWWLSNFDPTQKQK